MLSPPKTPRSKHGVYRALMLSPPDESGSPIRMKFTRVFPSSTSKSEAASDLLSTAPATKGSNASKKRKRAMKLVEKARAMQQNKKASAEEKGSLRRSSRSQPSTKTSYCQDEDSVVFLEEDQTAQEKKSKAQKGLRSLNDVLGKPTAPSKETRNSAGSKVTPMFVGKKAQRPSSVISILDESSLEGSEDGSQDGSEQSRARRDFLKSGLPESFKKQIAKTVAVKEAYSLSYSSFQPVVHVLQTAQDCPLWTLPWPVSPLLRCLKEFRSPAPNPLPSPKDPGLSPGHKTAPAARVHSERGSGWREEFSEEARRLLALEVSSSNPTFPVQRFLTRFLKRRADHALQCSAPEPDPAPEAPVAPATAEGAGGKRKRVDEGGDAAKVAKKPRSGRSEEETPAAVPAAAAVPDDPFATPSPEQPPRRRRGRPPGRAQRHTQQEEEMEVMEVEAADPAVQTTPLSSRRETRDAPVIVLGDSPPSTTGKEEPVREDVLWTEKYQPQHSGEVIGNTASVRRLHSWLKEWKLRVDREEKQQRQDRKQEEDSSDSWACGEGGPEEEEEELMCNTLLITGPSGSGKTASVYACALELGFKVFEVNASSQRSGRQILSQLKEATQSHQVDVRGVSAHKPAYFSSSSARLGSSPRRVNSPRRAAASSPRKAPQSPRGPRRGGLAPTSLAGFFKMGRPPGRERANPPDKTQQTVAPKKTTKAKEGSITKTKDAPPKPAARAKESSSGKTKDPPVPKPAAGAKTPSSQEPSKRAATSLILFEEVDVIFDDDWGFLAAIKTFMATTKRPVVLTTSDPTFGAMFDGFFEEIHFRTPSVVNVGSYLRLVCLAENMRTDAEDVSSLLRLTGCDVRQSLLHLQFWTRSSGGRQTPRPLPPSVEAAETLKKEEGSVEAADAASVRKAESKAPAPLPPCDTACTESMLGMLNAEPERDVLDLLKSCSTADPACWDLLRASRRRGVDLLYSNMEALLPLPVTLLPLPVTLLPLPVTLLPLPVTALNTTATRVAAAAARTQERRKEEEEEEETAGHAPPPLDRLLLRAAEGSEDDGSPLKLSSGMRRRKRRQQQRGGPDDHDPFHSDSDSDESAFLSLCRPPGGEGSRRVVGGDGEPAPAAPTRMRRAPPPLTPEQRMRSAPVSRCLGALAQFLDHMSLLDAMTTPTPPCPGGGEWAWLGLSGGGVEVKDGMTDEPREGPECAGGRWAERERGLEIRAALEGLSFQRCRAGAEEARALGRAGPGGEEEEAREELSLPVAPHRRGFSLTPDGPCEPKATQRRREVMDAVLSSRACGALGGRRAVAMDYLPALRAVCRAEQLKEQDKTKRRFLHYLTSISLGLPKSTLQSLAQDFP